MEKKSYPDENFPLAPEPVLLAWQEFWSRSQYLTHLRWHPENRQQYFTNVNKILSDFLGNGKNLSPAAYSAAMLIDLADSFHSHDITAGSKNAAIALKPALENMSEEDAALVNEILLDRVAMFKFWKNQTSELYGEQTDLYTYLTDKKTSVVPSKLWQTKPQFIRPKDLNDGLANKVQVESILISAARTLQNLYDSRASADPNERQNAQTLYNVFRAETLLAPLLDIMGVDGFAMALNSAALETRLENSGFGAYIEWANDIYAKYGDHGRVAEQVDQMFDDLTDEFIGEPAVEHDPAHRVLLGHGACVIDDLDMRFVWRRKGLGQLANKLEIAEEKALEKGKPTYTESAIEPMDFIGGTIIIPDDCDHGKVFASIVGTVMKNPNFKLRAAPSRSQAVHVRGSDSYQNEAVEALAEKGIGLRRIDKKEDDRGMNLAKITFTYGERNLPVELQVVTESVRRVMRYGQVSHFGYKLGADLTDDDLNALDVLHSRGQTATGLQVYPTNSNVSHFRTRLIETALAFNAHLANK